MEIKKAIDEFMDTWKHEIHFRNHWYPETFIQMESDLTALIESECEEKDEEIEKLTILLDAAKSAIPTIIEEACREQREACYNYYRSIPMGIRSITDIQDTPLITNKPESDE